MIKSYQFSVGQVEGQFSFDLDNLPATHAIHRENSYHTWINGASLIQDLNFTWNNIHYTSLGPGDAVWLGLWRGELNSVTFGRSPFTDSIPWIPSTGNCGSSFATEAWCLAASAEVHSVGPNGYLLYHSEIIPAHVDGLVYRVDEPSSWAIIFLLLAPALIWRKR